MIVRRLGHSLIVSIPWLYSLSLILPWVLPPIRTVPCGPRLPSPEIVNPLPSYIAKDKWKNSSIQMWERTSKSSASSGHSWTVQARPSDYSGGATIWFYQFLWFKFNNPPYNKYCESCRNAIWKSLVTSTEWQPCRIEILWFQIILRGYCPAKWYVDAAWPARRPPRHWHIWGKSRA